MPHDEMPHDEMPHDEMPHDEMSYDEMSYDELLAEAARLYPGVRIGRPGRARTYWPTVTALRAYRVKVAVDLDGAGNVAPGPAIFVANHTSTLDPVVVLRADRPCTPWTPCATRSA